MAKKILLSIFSIFLAYRSLELLRVMNVTSASQTTLVFNVSMAAAVNLFITGVFAFAGFAFATHRVLPSSYFKVKNPKAVSLMYNLFGVRYFKNILMLAYWGRQKNRKKYFDGTKAGLINFDYQTRQSEFGHLASFIAIQAFSFFILSKSHIQFFICATLINVLANAYPIVLQRFHRIQIQRLASRIKH